MQGAYRCGERSLTVTVQRTEPGRFTVTVDGGAPRSVQAALFDASTLHLTIDGAAHTLPVARVGDAYHIAIAGEVYVVAPSAAAAGERAVPLLSPHIVAPMPGKVLQVLVRAGDAVAAGDGVLILEAMKMEYRMVAEAAGTVRAVHVAGGQMVDAGTLLVELDYGTDPTDG
jgi:3-methylcrotonyl-CoA carboxylase alpha subunit